MNLYVVVEGDAETKVYPSWIAFLNPDLVRVNQVDLVTSDSYYLISGRGYPSYFDVVERAIEDIAASPQFDRLVVVVDSENESYLNKYNEIDQFVQSRNCRVQHRIVVQHFCLETWALGNKRIFRRNPADAQLKEYVRLFDVSTTDPELLTAPYEEELNRAQFAYKYLRLLLQDRNPKLIYSKRNPREIGEQHYFDRVKERFVVDHHIQSFGGLLTAFN